MTTKESQSQKQTGNSQSMNMPEIHVQSICYVYTKKVAYLVTQLNNLLKGLDVVHSISEGIFISNSGYSYKSEIRLNEEFSKNADLYQDIEHLLSLNWEVDIEPGAFTNKSIAEEGKVGISIHTPLGVKSDYSGKAIMNWDKDKVEEYLDGFIAELTDKVENMRKEVKNFLEKDTSQQKKKSTTKKTQNTNKGQQKQNKTQKKSSGTSQVEKSGATKTQNTNKGQKQSKNQSKGKSQQKKTNGKKDTVSAVEKDEILLSLKKGVHDPDKITDKLNGTEIKKHINYRKNKAKKAEYEYIGIDKAKNQIIVK